MMLSVRSVRWLVSVACIALAAACGNDSTRVLEPGHATRGAATGGNRVGRTFAPDGPNPCNPSYAGPVFSVFGPGLEYHYPTGGYSLDPGAQVPIEIPANRTVTFQWSADPSGGCTDIRWYNWALDIEDVDDQTPRTDEATDLAHWSVRSLATSATIGPFTTAAPNPHYLYVQASDGLGYMSLAVIRITVVEAVNRPPNVQSATAQLTVDGAPNGDFSPVRVAGVTDPDGDPITITIIGITQDEPLLGRGMRPTCPDGRIVGGAASVRRERSGTGNGRVYTIAFLATDGQGGSSPGTAEVCIPHGLSGRGCSRDALVVNSLESCDARVARGTSFP